MARRGESRREVQMTSALDSVPIAQAPQPQRIIRRRVAQQLHSTPPYDYQFSAIIMESMCAPSLAASANESHAACKANVQNALL